MKKLILLFVILIIVLFALFPFQNQSPKNQEPKTKNFTIALDWTPNTNHTGIYVALQKGWYKEQGLDIKILPYSQVSADTLVSTGKADAGISSTENIVADAATGNPVVSIAAIIAHNTSALVALSDSDIKSPRDLDGKIYGGFGLPYEQAVVSEVIKHDGGTGEFKNVTLTTSAMQALESKKIDFVWIFMSWEGIEANRAKLGLKVFPIPMFGIPDYSTPNIITSKKTLEEKKLLIKKFMNATKRGFEYARIHPKESAQILIDATPKGTFPDTGLVTDSQIFLSPLYADPGKAWGLQDKAMWHNYPKFMLQAGAVTDVEGKKVTKLDLESLYTNEFLQ